MPKIKEKDLKNLEKVKVMLDNFVKEADVYIGRGKNMYLSEINEDRHTHCFVAGIYSTADENVYRVAIGTAGPDGFDPEIKMPMVLNNNGNEDKSYGTIAELAKLNQAQFNYAMERILDDLQINVGGYERFKWYAKNDFERDLVDLEHVAPDIMTNAERVALDLKKVDMSSLTERDKVSIAIDMTIKYIDAGEYLIPEAGFAFQSSITKLGLDGQSIDEKIPSIVDLREATLDSGKYIASLAAATSIEPSEDLLNLAQAWQFADERKGHRTINLENFEKENIEIERS